MQGLIEFVKTLGPTRLAAMGAVTVALIGFFALLIMRVTAPTMVQLGVELSAMHTRARLAEGIELALDIVEPLASRNPDWLDIQVLVAQILCDTPGAEQEAAAKVVSLRRAYKLTAQAEGHIAAAEAELTKRQPAG